MKLKLSNEGKTAVLDISEDVAAANVPIIKAGVLKILQSGKTQIVINLLEAKQLTTPVMVELVKVHLTAVEQKGEIILVGHGDVVKEAIKSFPNPPAIKYFPTREAAIGALAATAPAADAKPKSNVPDPSDELRAKIAALEAENKTLKGQVTNRSGDDSRKLKAEYTAMQKQVSTLEEQLAHLTKDRKKPFDSDTLNAKIAQLEQALGEAVGKDAAVAKK